MNKDYYESLRRIEMENHPSAYIPTYEECKSAIQQVLIDNKVSSTDEWLLCLDAEEKFNNPDTYIPMVLFETILSDINAV